MKVSEYVRYDGVELASLIRNGEISREEVSEAAARALAIVDAEVNCLTGASRPVPPEAEDDAPLDGVPFLIKDIAVPFEGVPCEMGSRIAKGFVSNHDGYLTQRYKAAGLAVLGQSTTPEFGFSATTEPVKGGPTCNPWNPTRMTGGSSGGAAAAVAGGAVPIAHGSDAAGSIRIPSACCGLFGLKPSRGRTPYGPASSNAPFGHYSDHVLTRSVRDSATVLDACATPIPGETYFAPGAPPSFLEASLVSPEPLKIAVSVKAPNGGRVDPETAHSVKRAGLLCASLGHHVEEAEPDFSWEEFLRISKVMHNILRPSRIDAIAEVTGLEPGPHTLEEINLTGYLVGKRLSSYDIAGALVLANKLSHQMAGFFSRYDVLIQPVTTSPALPLGSLKTDGMGWSHDQYLDDLFSFCPFTGAYNITGQPAMSMPLYQATNGLPLGVQFVAGAGQEALLFSLAGQLEEALPWKDRVSPLHQSLLSLD